MGLGTTGNTTAKLTSAHSLMYSQMIKKFGMEKAKLYLEANEEAIKKAEGIINKEKVECDFKKQDSYIITNKKDNIKALEDEYKALKEIGANVELVSTMDLPIDIEKGICYKNQAQFHPIKYLNALAHKAIEKGVNIYENTKVIKIDKKDSVYEIVTEGHKVIAKKVIIATHYPIKNIPGYYFMKMYQERSYIIGIKTNSPTFEGMYITAESPVKSFRTVDTKEGQIILIGGEEHKAGDDKVKTNAYDKLEEYAKTVYPDAKVIYKWSAQDCMPIDNVPYIGEYSNLTPNMYVATGYKKWGMTTAHIAAEIIVNKILKKENKYEEVFLSTRFKPISSAKELGGILKETVESLVVKRFKLPKATIVGIKPGDAAIVSGNAMNNAQIVGTDSHGDEASKADKIGIYKDEEGNLFAINPICAHLGCELAFNITEKTWDCPCHGSRFDIYGKNISEPAVKNIEKVEIEYEQ